MLLSGFLMLPYVSTYVDDLRGCEVAGEPHSYEIFGTLPTHCSFYVQQVVPYDDGSLVDDDVH
jgi:hypothetical protein